MTESMLRDFVETKLSIKEVGDLLTMTGFELEEIFSAEGEDVLDVNIMVNRGDGASVLGLAREVLAKDPQAKPTDLTLRLTSGCRQPDSGSRDIWEKTTVEIQTPECTRYACRIFEGVVNGESPAWIQERLRKVGQRPISLLVDLTNYVMLETGQPLHAFDLDKLAGERIIVRQAREGEKLTTLDGTEHELRPDQMMICDGEKPVAAAGIMGGEATEVSATTTRCLLESAHFLNTSVRRTRKQMGLHTEASYRFERWVDPEMVVTALNRFSELLQEAGGPKPVPGVADSYQTKPVPNVIRARVSRATKIGGMAVSRDEARTYLTKLGFNVTLDDDPDAWTVSTPSWRIDVVREEDVIEEILRIHGYEKIPEALVIGSTPLGGSHGIEAVAEKVRETLLRSGLDEAISHSLRAPHPLDATTDLVRVRNPHSPEAACLRNSILPCLADVVLRNGGNDVHFFEHGHVFAANEERQQVGILTTGSLEPASWHKGNTGQSDFFSLKSLIEAVCQGFWHVPEFVPSQDPRLHPTRQAEVKIKGQRVALLGQIHPEAAEQASLPLATCLAEIEISTLAHLPEGLPATKSLSRNPASKRDIAMMFAKTVPYSTIEAALKKAGGELLEKYSLFDIYDGQGIPEGHHSLAFSLILRKPGETFTDEEANQVRDEIVAELTSLGGKLR
ncbi:MAG: phenylalanine--tRNA ligase subunit beta [Fimbriimonadaceae bacterium]|nr:phenylalanine--tRNA ligase subunit beta [Fimbriimonadaceae bacterium]